jgi:hypothetical protein
MDEWRGNLFKAKYLSMARPFSAVPELLRRVRQAGMRVAVATLQRQANSTSTSKSLVSTVGLLCGGFPEAELRKGGCVAVYPGPAALIDCFDASTLRRLPARQRYEIDGSTAYVTFIVASNGDRFQPITETSDGRKLVRRHPVGRQLRGSRSLAAT